MNSTRRERALEFAERVLRYVVTIFRYLGLFVFLFMATVLWKLWVLHTSGKEAPGRVVGFHESQGSNAASKMSRDPDRTYTLYYPIIQFEAEGRTWKFTSNDGSHGRAYEVGQETRVLYNPKNPQAAEIARTVKTISRLWVTAGLLFSSGLFFFWISYQLPGWWTRFGGGLARSADDPGYPQGQ